MTYFPSQIIVRRIRRIKSELAARDVLYKGDWYRPAVVDMGVFDVPQYTFPPTRGHTKVRTAPVGFRQYWILPEQYSVDIYNKILLILSLRRHAADIAAES
jgi:hypothetical protein